MAWHVIPLDSTPDQQFDVTVDVGGINIPLILHLRYNTEGDFWKMDITDGKTKNMLIAGAPLLTGNYPSADILHQFQHLGIGSAIIVKNTDVTADDFPTVLDLGTDFLLLWGEIDA